ncbi:MAG: radical SAM protein [Fibrobacter sp.]|nr:radical SAM protein [Fibrobacter sp.]
MKYAYIEITKKCNLSCPFCPSANLNGHRGEMPLSLFEKILENLQGKVQEIFLHVLGEPLLHPQFAEILKAVDASGLKLNLTTNGVLIAKHADKLLASSALRQINFSTHAYAYLPKEKALNVLNDSFAFAERLNAERPEVYLNFRLWNDKADATSDAWNETVFRLLSERFQADLSPTAFSVRHKSFPITGRLYLHRDSRFIWPNGLGEEKENGTCHGMIDQCAILFDGTVVPCCLDYKANIPLGKIPGETWDSIFQSEKAERIRKGFEQHKLLDPFCKRCPFARRFR